MGHDVSGAYREFCRKRIAMAAAVGLVFLLLGMGSVLEPSQGVIQKGGVIKRPGYGEGDREVKVVAGIYEGEKEQKEERYIVIKEQKYGEREWEQAVAAAKDYIDQTICGENESPEHIAKPLNLVQKIPESALTLTWDRGEGIIGPDGEISTDNPLPEGSVTCVTAVLGYEGREARYPIFLRVFPAELTEREKLNKRLDEAILKAQEETETKAVLPLPEGDGQVRFTYEEKQESRTGVFLILGILASAAAALSAGRDLDRRMRCRERQMLMDYPSLIHKFSLLLGAGMTLKKAWETIVSEYLEQKKKGATGIRYAYEEMAVTMRDLDNGIPERQAFDSFGKRVRLLPYQKWISLLQQNLRKGTKGLMDALELEALEAGEERKKLTRQLGEEAGTRLLLPMGMMLLIVLVIIIVPAFRTF